MRNIKLEDNEACNIAFKNTDLVEVAKASTEVYSLILIKQNVEIEKLSAH
jgi:hypothetical protein